MKDRKTMHEAYWEAIHVECMLRRSRIQKLKSLVGKSQEISEALVAEPMAEDIKVDKEMQELEPGDNGIDHVDRQMQEVNEDDMVSKETEHPLDFIITPFSEKPIRSSENKSVFARAHKMIYLLKSLALTLSLGINNGNLKIAIGIYRSYNFCIERFNCTSMQNQATKRRNISGLI